MNLVSAPDLLDQPSTKGIAKAIEDRLSQELVIALIGTVASGISTAAEFIHEILKSDFGYLVAPIIKPSAKSYLNGFVRQARAQLEAAGPRAVIWYFAERETANLADQAFKEERDLAGKIKVRYVEAIVK